ncbi:AsmA family protein [Salinivibrio sp. ES.052]|uniref:AsmA family protein n=1 Tax=Salinivibrio sp. ES.052 TaxID=1882823 RepID=UPI000928A685|nr:AsmA family protein [Salinivibrio sp. ES.052]SIO24205.1 AsmA family protein [Salinivibrio sp. ES.052]
MRILAKLFASFVILSVTALLVIVVILHTRHSTQLFHTLVTPLVPGELTVKQIHYHWRHPLTLSLTQPDYQRDGQHWQADTIQIQFSSNQISHLQWARIDGLTLNLTDHAVPHLNMLPKTLSIGRVLFNNLTIKGSNWQASQVSAQLDDWRKGQSPVGEVSGRVQWQIKQVNWQGLRLSQLLLDAMPTPSGWQLNGVSFQWQRAAFSAQGTWQPGTLALTQLTVSDMIIDSEQTHQRLIKTLSRWPDTTTLTIERADIRQLSADTNTLSINNLTLSAEQLRFSPHTPWWQQPQLRASFNADYVRWQEQTWEQPLGDIERHGETWVINQLTSQWQEGFIALSGQFSDSDWQIDRLQANGLTLSQPILAPLIQTLPNWPDRLSITDLSLKHNEWLALSTQFPVKISGIDVDGRTLRLHHRKQWQLTNGVLTASANHASINHQWLAEPYLRLDANDGKITLHQLLLGFPDGQLAASGQWNINTPSQPWALQVDGLQIPLSIYQDWFNWPLPLSGFHDIEGEWSGLAADKESFSVGLNGKMEIVLFDAQANVDPDKDWSERIAIWFSDKRSGTRQEQAFPFESLSIEADRGLITGELQGDTPRLINWPIFQHTAPRIR